MTDRESPLDTSGAALDFAHYDEIQKDGGGLIAWLAHAQEGDELPSAYHATDPDPDAGRRRLLRALVAVGLIPKPQPGEPLVAIEARAVQAARAWLARNREQAGGEVETAHGTAHGRRDRPPQRGFPTVSPTGNRESSRGLTRNHEASRFLDDTGGLWLPER